MTSLSFFPQERPESCVPACLRMVLTHYGLKHTEAEIYTCCETDIEGTLPSAAARCAQNLGFEAVTSRLSGLEALQERIDTGYIFPIAYINLSPILGINVIHAVIVDSIDTEVGQIQVIDPTYPPSGYRTLLLGLFETGWGIARNQTILVKPQA